MTCATRTPGQRHLPIRWRRLVRSLCVWAWGFAGAWVYAGTPGADCMAAMAVPWQRLAPGIWVWQTAEPGEVSSVNGGHVAPTTVVIDGAEAFVIDPGPSHRHGLLVRQSLECRFGARVRGIVNTHAHAENVLANSAFADLLAAGTLVIWATTATRVAMQRRCTNCLASLTERVGADAMAGTRIVLPNRTLTEGERLRMGRHTLLVMRVEQGHTEGDLVLWHARHRVLWVGGLVYDGRVPELAQGRVEDWLQALGRLEGLRPRHVVSSVVSRSSGAEQQPAALGATRGYLEALRQGVLKAMDGGRQPQEVDLVELPGYRTWSGYAERHGFNVQRVWRELEPVWMEQGTPAGAASPAQVGR